MDEKPNKTDLPQDPPADSPGTQGAAGEEDFARMFAASLESTEEGQVIHGKVIKVLKEYVAVDINKKSEGMLPLEDLPEEERAAFQPGDPIEVMTEGYDQAQGFIRLSRSKVVKIRVWDDLQKAFDEGTPVTGAIVAKVKGGYTVDIGVKAFLPGSQVDLRPVRDNDPVIGIQGKFKILKFSRKKANVVVSRRSFMEEERDVLRKGLLDHIQEGDTIEARVKNITDYGVFMDLGGLDGLMHVTDMSYGKVGHPSDVCKVGDLLTVKVIRFDRERGRISLGLKQTKSDPWLELEARYRPGLRVKGKVTNTTKYGAFVELEEGVEGLLHISEMSWSKRLKDPSEVMKAGDAVEVVVLKVDKGNKKISLGYKQLLGNPWDDLKSRHPEGSTVEGTVKNVADFGVFVDIGEDIDGLVHVSDLSWNTRVKNPGELFKKGDNGVRAKVLKIDPESQKFSLGVKHLAEDPWAGIEKRFRKGDLVNGKVTRVADFGAFVEIAEGIEGLVHVSEISREKVESPGAVLKAGDEVGAVVLGVDRANRKVSLSIRGYADALERKDAESYLGKQSETNHDNIGALGEALLAKMKSNGEQGG
ncbi:MAG: 30S ribosomal protein S1 [Deltaproteobacteria bacterium]|nr:30S ribosomal protein S1 [Deltaproteobacteria bacterium]